MAHLDAAMLISRASPEDTMNVALVPRSVLKFHIEAVEAKFPLKVVGLLPRGSAAYVFGEEALDLLAKKQPNLSLLTVSQAEVELSDRLGRPVGIVLTSEVRGDEAARLSAAARPL